MWELYHSWGLSVCLLVSPPQNLLPLLPVSQWFNSELHLGWGQCQTSQGKRAGNTAAGNYKTTCSDMSFCPCQSGLACILEEEGLDLLHFILSHVALDVLFHPLKHLILSCSLQSSWPPWWQWFPSVLSLRSFPGSFWWACGFTGIWAPVLWMSSSENCLSSCCLSSSTKFSSLSCNWPGQCGWIPIWIKREREKCCHYHF